MTSSCTDNQTIERRKTDWVKCNMAGVETGNDSRIPIFTFMDFTCYFGQETIL
jgi:hypothetical protein